MAHCSLAYQRRGLELPVAARACAAGRLVRKLHLEDTCVWQGRSLLVVGRRAAILRRYEWRYRKHSAQEANVPSTMAVLRTFSESCENPSHQTLRQDSALATVGQARRTKHRATVDLDTRNTSSARRLQPVQPLHKRGSSVVTRVTRAF